LQLQLQLQRKRRPTEAYQKREELGLGVVSALCVVSRQHHIAKQ
jgi:hypothetical protein